MCTAVRALSTYASFISALALVVLIQDFSRYAAEHRLREVTRKRLREFQDIENIPILVLALLNE